MLYENYQKRILRVADVLSKIVRHMALIIAVLSTMVAAGMTLLCTKGIVGELQCPDSIIYGDTATASAGAFLSDVHYEYRAQKDDAAWTSGLPKYPGTYLIRASAPNSFGGFYHSGEKVMNVLPRPIEVSVNEAMIRYGDTPSVFSPSLSYRDRVFCDTYHFGDLSQSTTTVVAEKNAVRIEDEGGNDMTWAYDIRMLTSEILLTPRQITVTVNDASKVYDGLPLTFDQYELSDGTLSDKDMLIAVFEKSQTDVGSVLNTPVLTVLHGDQNVNVTHLYHIEQVVGQLTVEKRPLYIHTGSMETVYDGTVHQHETYELDESTALAEGEYLECYRPTYWIDSGTYENYLSFVIFDDLGAEKTNNYSLLFDPGTITIHKKDLHVISGSTSWVYDGEVHYCTDFTHEGLINGMRIYTDTWTTAIDQTLPNEIAVTVHDHTGDVTKNYNITYEYGTLELLPRKVTLQTLSNSKTYYNGQAHSRKEYRLFVDGVQYSSLPYGNNKLIIGSWTERIDAGTEKNVCSEISVRSNPVYYGTPVLGKDMSHCYEFEFIYGDITVDLRPITVRPVYAEKIYDGTSLTATKLEVIRNTTMLSFSELVEGHVLAGTTAGEQTDVGRAVTSVLSADVLDAEGNSVSKNYDFFYAENDVTVLPRPITVMTGSASKIYDGTPLTCGEYGIADTSEYVLLEGHILSLLPEGSQTEEGTSENFCDENLTYITDASGRDVTFNYDIEYDFGTLKVSYQAKMIITAYSAKKMYDATPLTANGYYRDVYEGEIPEDHRLVVTVEGSVTNFTGNTPVPNVITSYCILDKDGNDVTIGYKIETEEGKLEILRRTIKVQTGSASKPYDGTPLTCNEYGIAEESSYPLVDGHMLFLVVIGSQTEEGSSDNLCFRGGTVITDADGTDVTRNYSIDYIYGTLWVYYYGKLNLTANSDEKIYDGEPLVNGGYEVHVYEGRLAEGHRLIVTTEGSIVNAGSVWNRIVSYKIVNESGTDVTIGYLIDTYDGILKVLRRPITVYTGSATKFYDGTPLTCGEYGMADTTQYPLLDGHTLTVYPTGSQVEAGFCSNVCQKSATTIMSDSGNVTRNYAITYEYGTLTVQYRAVLDIYTEGAEKIYDGTPLENHQYRVEYSQIIDMPADHALSVTFVASLTEAGESPNGALATILDGEGNDLTINYRINFHEGLLRVKKRPITVVTGSAEKYYDGTALTKKEYGISPDSEYPLVEGDTLTLRVNGSQTSIGHSQNVCRESLTRIRSSLGEYVQDNYQIKYDYGKLTVKGQARIVILTGSASKTYDGTPLTCNEYQVKFVDGELAEGHVLTVMITGSLTKVGTAQNSATYSITDEYGNSVQSIYEIELRPGELTVYPEEDDEIPQTVFGELYSYEDTLLYLKMNSYDTYLSSGGTPWGASLDAEYIKTLPNGLNYSYLTAMALRNGGYANKYASIINSSLYMLPYYIGADGDYTKRPGDMKITGVVDSEYDFWYYSMPASMINYSALEGLLGEYAPYEEEYRAFVHSVYLSLDAQTRAFMQEIIESQGFDPNDPDLIGKVARYIQNAATYNLKYDRSLDSASNVAIAFLSEYREGVCRHYATAATLLYRALGIPARYVEGFAVQTVAGEYVEIKNPGHAWVEIYIDGLGWIYVEVTGGSGGNGTGGSGGNGSGGTQAKPKLSLTPVFRSKFYDGLPLYPENRLDANSALDRLLDLGYFYSVSVVGEQTEVGVSESHIIDFRLYNPYGEDVTLQYDIEYCNGTLEVYSNEKTMIRLWLYECKGIYTGKPLYITEEDYEILEMDEDLDLDISFNIALTDVGSISVDDINANLSEYVSYRIWRDGEDVTDQYILYFDTLSDDGSSYMPLSVSPMSIEITAGSKEQIYNENDPQPLTCDEYRITMGSLIKGHRAIVQITGSITEVGEEINYIDYVLIVDEDGNDVTHNYSIVCVNGILKVLEP